VASPSHLFCTVLCFDPSPGQHSGRAQCHRLACVLCLLHLLCAAALMSSVYEDHKDEDGFLYITYSGENTFGSSSSSADSSGVLELQAQLSQ
jgi:hypothetical protein